MTASMTTMTSLLEKNDVIEPFQDNAIIHGDITEHRRGENRPERWIRISSAKFVDGAFGHIHLEKLENPKNEKKTTLRVVKVIPEQQAKDNETLFFREVKAMATCRRREYREYFVQMRCWFVANGAYHIAMEYCPHGDLDEFCRKGPLPEQYARTVVKQVLQGLRFFHGQGFAHRDLKPKNILVYEIPTDSTELKVKIADFGISKRARPDDNTKYSSVCGTLGFLAPEVLEKKATYNESVDIWSVGCLQYWLLTKAEDTIFFRGFQEDSNDDGGTIVLRNLQARNVSSNAIAFLLRTLQREPRDRPTADQALRLSWMVREVINYGSDDDSDSDTSTVIISDSRLPTSPISPSSITDSGPCDEPEDIEDNEQTIRWSRQPVRRVPPPRPRDTGLRSDLLSRQSVPERPLDQSIGYLRSGPEQKMAHGEAPGPKQFLSKQARKETINDEAELHSAAQVLSETQPVLEELPAPGRFLNKQARKETINEEYVREAQIGDSRVALEEVPNPRRFFHMQARKETIYGSEATGQHVGEPLRGASVLEEAEAIQPSEGRSKVPRKEKDVKESFISGSKDKQFRKPKAKRIPSFKSRPNEAPPRLVQAVLDQRLDHLNAILSPVVDIADTNAMDSEGRTALWHAANLGNVDMAKIIVNAIGSRDLHRHEDNKRWTPIHTASANGHAPMISFLLTQSTAATYWQGSLTARTSPNQETPFLLAVKHEHFEAVRALLGFEGENHYLNIPDSLDSTPLMHAMASGNRRIIDALLQKAGVAEYETPNGKSALWFAADLQDEEMFMKLLNLFTGSSGSVDEMVKGTKRHVYKVLQILSSSSLSAECRKQRIDFLLHKRQHTIHPRLTRSEFHDVLLKELFHMAAEDGEFGSISTLLDYYRGKGVRVLAEEVDIRRAMIRAAGTGNMTLVQKLLDTGAVDVNAQDPEVSNTVLISAVRYGRVNFVKALLKAYRQKLDLNAQDVAGRTALIVAVETGDREIISILLESGSRQAISTKDELTALHIAAANADYDIVKLLVDIGPVSEHINKRDAFKCTPISAAAECSAGAKVIKLLLERGADPDLPDCNGMAPLAKAARLGHVDNVKAFLSNEHRNISPVDYQDQTPLLLAAQSLERTGKKIFGQVVLEILKNARVSNSELRSLQKEAFIMLKSIKYSKPPEGRVDLMDPDTWESIMLKTDEYWSFHKANGTKSEESGSKTYSHPKKKTVTRSETDKPRASRRSSPPETVHVSYDQTPHSPPSPMFGAYTTPHRDSTTPRTRDYEENQTPDHYTEYSNGHPQPQPPRSEYYYQSQSNPRPPSRQRTEPTYVTPNGPYRTQRPEPRYHNIPYREPRPDPNYRLAAGYNSPYPSPQQASYAEGPFQASNSRPALSINPQAEVPRNMPFPPSGGGYLSPESANTGYPGPIYSRGDVPSRPRSTSMAGPGQWHPHGLPTEQLSYAHSHARSTDNLPSRTRSSSYTGHRRGGNSPSLSPQQYSEYPPPPAVYGQSPYSATPLQPSPFSPGYVSQQPPQHYPPNQDPPLVAPGAPYMASHTPNQNHRRSYGEPGY